MAILEIAGIMVAIVGVVVILLALGKAFPGKLGGALGIVLLLAGLGMNYSFFAGLTAAPDAELKGEYVASWLRSGAFDASAATLDSASSSVSADGLVLSLWDTDTNFDDDSTSTTSTQWNFTLYREAGTGEETTDVETVAFDVGSVDTVTLSSDGTSRPLFSYDDSIDAYTVTWGGGIVAGAGSLGRIDMNPGDSEIDLTAVLLMNEDAFTAAIIDQYSWTLVVAGNVLNCNFIVTANSV